MTKLDWKTRVAIQDEVTAACQAIAQKYDIKLGRVQAKESGPSYHMGVSFDDVGDDGMVTQTDALKRLAQRFNLNIEGERIYQGVLYRLIDYVPSRPKYPFLVIDRSGRKMKFSHALVTQLWQGAPLRQIA